ncbi:hypothetical protein ACTMU2_17055 [Cupriavidus basilensis]
MGDLRHDDLPDDSRGAWVLVFVGKGAVEREVHVSHAVIAALRRYLVARGLGEDFGRLHPATPLVGRVKADGRVGALSVGQLHAILTRFFKQAAVALQDEDSGRCRPTRRSQRALAQTFVWHALNQRWCRDRRGLKPSSAMPASLLPRSMSRTQAERRAQELERVGIF